VPIDPAAFAVHALRLHAREKKLIWTRDWQLAQRVGIDLMLRVLIAGIGFLIDRHQAHQMAHSVATVSMALPLHIPHHSLPARVLRRNVPRGRRAPYQGVSKNCLSLPGSMLCMHRPGNGCFPATVNSQNFLPSVDSRDLTGPRTASNIAATD